MKRIKDIVYHFFEMSVDKKRQLYHNFRSKKLKKQNITLLSNNCLAGILYHDFQIKFNSPTINLFFEKDEDYIEFLTDIDYYSATEPIEKIVDKVTWPVGEIQKGDNTITIHFMHYKSFDEAKEKWIERGKRIDKDNMYILWLVGNTVGPSVENYNKFKRLNYKNKILITGNDFPFHEEIIVNPEFLNEDNTPGKWAKFQRKISSKRYIDQVDFVKYFNEMK